MSFGFGVGDFITVLALANTLRERFQDAPAQYNAISDEVQSLNIVLSKAKSTLQGRKLSKEHTGDLEVISRGCRNVLEELNQELEGYFGGQNGTDRGKLRKIWGRLRWDQKAIDAYRSRIVSHVSMLNTFIAETQSHAASNASKVDEKQAILNWLDAVDYAERQSDFLSLREEGTGQWFLTSEKLKLWCSKGKQTLFCPGIPGAGKTVLASVIINYLQEEFRNDETVPVVYIYCNFKMSQSQKIKDLLKSLLRQFIQQRPTVPKSMQELYDRHAKQGTLPTRNDLSKVVGTVAATYARPLIVIDALDECEMKEGTRDQFLEELLSLQTRTQASLMIICRPIYEIARRLKDCVRFEIRAQPQDVKKYIESRLGQLPAFVGRNEKLKERITTTIVNSVKGMFLLAQLLFESLRGKPNPKKLNAVLKQIEEKSALESEESVEKIEYAYGKAMERINSQEKDFMELAHLALSWITLARSPLNIQELQSALAVEEESTELDEDNISDREDILNACAGLVTVDDESSLVRLVHYTAQGYFEKTWKEWFPSAQMHISRACITYLSFDTFGQLCMTAEEVEQRVADHAFYRYAALNWGYHVHSASVEKDELVIRFLASREKTSSAYQVIRVGKREQHGITGLHLAAYFGLKEAVAQLLTMDHDVDQKDGWQRTALSYAAEYGHEDVVRYLVEERHMEINSEGDNSLTLAAKRGHKNVVEYLMSRKQVNPSSSAVDGESAVIEAILAGDEAMVQLLLSQHDVDLNQERLGYTILGQVAREGNEAMLQIILENSAVEVNVNMGNMWNETPLILAAELGHEGVVKLLLSRSDIILDSQEARNTHSALAWAAWNGHETVAKLLLSAKANPNVRDYRNQTPLSLAAEYGFEGVVRILLEYNPEVDSKDCYQQTPLSFAAKNGHRDIVERLLDAGASPNSRDSVYGKTPLLWAAERGHSEVVDLLLRCGDVQCNEADKQGQTALLWAAYTDNNVVMERLLSIESIDVNRVDKIFHRCPLAVAAQKGNTAMVQKLLQHGADVRSIDANGSTPLLWAAWAGRGEIVKIFLTIEGIEIDRADSRGQTPLSWAAEMGHHDVVHILLDQGADPNSRDFRGRPPVWWAAWNGHVDVTQVFLALDHVDVNETDEDGWRPLLWAFWNGHSRLVEILQQHGLESGSSTATNQELNDIVHARLAQENHIDFHSESFRYKPPLLWGAENNDSEILYLALVEKDVREISLPEMGAALIAAARNGFEDAVELLLEGHYIPVTTNTHRYLLWSFVEAADRSFMGILEILAKYISPDSVELFTQTSLLRSAISDNRMDVVRFLLQKGIDVNTKLSGPDIIIWAANYADADILKLLLERGGKTDVVDSEHGQTPLIWAIQRGREDAVRLLLEQGADPNSKGQCGFTPLVWAKQKGDKAIIEMIKAHGGE